MNNQAHTFGSFGPAVLRITLFLLLFTNVAYGQRFELLYGGVGSGAGHIDEVTNNFAGGSVTLGSQSGHQHPRPLIVKTNRFGQILWTQLYEPASNYLPLDGTGAIMQATDGSNDIIWASTPSRLVGSTVFLEIYVCRLDQNGGQIWGRKLGSLSRIDHVTGLTMAPNGDIIVIGTTQTANDTDHRIYVGRLDGGGNVIFQRAFRPEFGSVAAVAVAVDAVSNDIYVLASYVNQGHSDFLLLSLTSAGAVNYARVYGGLFDQVPFDMIIDANADIVMLGSDDSDGLTDIYAVKTNSLGTVLNARRYFHSANSMATGMALTPDLSDNGYVITGRLLQDINCTNCLSDLFAIALNSNLTFNGGIPRYIYGSDSTEEYGMDIVRSEISDPFTIGYFISGAHSPQPAAMGSYLLRLNSVLSTGCQEAIAFSSAQREISAAITVNHITPDYNESKLYNYDSFDTAQYYCPLKNPKAIAPAVGEQHDPAASMIYPNPVPGGEAAVLRISLPEDGSVFLYLRDLRGRSVIQRRYVLNAGQHELKLPMPDVAPGAYSLHVNGAGLSRAVPLLVGN